MSTAQPTTCTMNDARTMAGSVCLAAIWVDSMMFVSNALDESVPADTSAEP